MKDDLRPGWRTPLRNRVDPFGDLFASTRRGALMGNRGGRFHGEGRTLGARRWASKQWICCVLDFKDRRREVWGEGYTELFFLDEATALAAGHRPCFECRREAALAFRRAAFGSAVTAPQMDVILHAERLAPKARLRCEAAEALPAGAMIGEPVSRTAWLRTDGGWLRWRPEGYAPGAPPDAPLLSLTPPASLRALREGFAPAGLPG